MARKTKEEAELTRKKLIKSALLVFSEQGVAHTTLTDISKRAEVTKGAFYWHFKNKLEVFDAMHQEYSEPLDKEADAMLKASGDPIQALFNTLEFYFSRVEASEEMIALFDVSFYKCEYTKDFAPQLRLEQEHLMKTKGDLSHALSRVDQEVWPTKSQSAIDSLSAVLVDCILGVLMRWVREPKGSLVEDIKTTVTLLLKGAGIQF